MIEGGQSNKNVTYILKINRLLTLHTLCNLMYYKKVKFKIGTRQKCFMTN